MMSREENLEWLRCRTEEYRAGKNELSNLVEEMEHDGIVGLFFGRV
jgi:hypothetical protein